MSPTILLIWAISVSKGSDLFSHRVTTVSWLIFMHWVYFCGLGTSKGMQRLVSDHQCLFVSCEDVTLLFGGIRTCMA